MNQIFGLYGFEIRSYGKNKAELLGAPMHSVSKYDGPLLWAVTLVGKSCQTAIAPQGRTWKVLLDSVALELTLADVYNREAL